MTAIKRLWFVIGVACRVLLVSFLLMAIWLCFLPYYLTRPIEFVNLPGEIAKSRMPAWWPESIAPADIEAISGQIDSEIDSYVGWYRIKAPPKTAEKWQDTLHSQLKDAPPFGNRFKIVEGVHRTVLSPQLPPDPSITGDRHPRPNWWTPGTAEFRVTERMRWYDTNDFGCGDAVYSCFDPATKTLWVYAQKRQHHLLWQPRQIPAGNQFVVRIDKTAAAAIPPLPNRDEAE